MSHGLTLSPAGRFLDVGADPASARQDDLTQAFAESRAAGLIALARQRGSDEHGPDLLFWRAFARRLLSALCGLGEAPLSAWKDVEPPSPEELEELVGSAPPMRGLEYLNADLLHELWGELAATAAKQAAAWKDGVAAWLNDVDPVFHQLGRVTFHLAENKRDPDKPFAFLATFAHRVSERDKVAHVPLAQALKESAGKGESGKLKTLLVPVERAAESSPLVRELLESRALFSPQAWPIRQAYRFLQEIPRMETAGVVVRVPNWWSHRAPPRARVQVRLGKQPPGSLGLDGLLDFDVGLTLDGDRLTDAERQQLLQATDGLALLRGKWVEVDRDRLREALEHWKQIEKSHGGGLDFIQGMRLLSGAALGETESLHAATAAWSDLVPGDWLRQTLAQMRHPDPDRTCNPGRDLQATLRPYQVEGVRWLWFMTQLGLGACLADDMGLGKTIQVIDLFLQRRRAAPRENPPARRPGDKAMRPGGEGLGRSTVPINLLVVPASLLGNWRQELERFAPTLKVRLLHRSECDAETLSRIAASPEIEFAGVDVVVTTYSFVRRQPWLAGVAWSAVVLDEAQAIKNAGSAQTKAVKALPGRLRLALTGTPVENHLGDLWSLFDFTCPGLLGTAAEFQKYVKRLNERGDPNAYASLRHLVRPYFLRRLKTDPAVAPDLPSKTELRAECGLSKKQAAMYEKAVADMARQLRDAEGIARKGLVLSTLMQLKQICNHPSQYLHRQEFPPAESAKFERLRLLCEPIVERQEKALVFTQFQSLTQPLADWLAAIFERSGLVLHGGTPVKKRSELVKAFQSADGPPFFVISLKAGGSGLNLTAASHVIHFDRWWNPAVENQATDRAFRIGQKRNVLVHKFVCRGTVEERIDQLIASKQAVADQILGSDDGTETRLTEMSDDELLGFVSLDLRRALDDE